MHPKGYLQDCGALQASEGAKTPPRIRSPTRWRFRLCGLIRSIGPVSQYIMMTDSRNKLIWDVVMLVAVLFSAFTVPMLIAILDEVHAPPTPLL